MKFGFNFKQGFISALLEDYGYFLPRYCSDSHGYSFGKGFTKSINLTETYFEDGEFKERNIGIFTLDEFKKEFAPWIEKELNIKLQLFQQVKDIKARKEALDIIRKANLNKENNPGHRPKDYFNLSFSNRYYIHNFGIHQIVWARRGQDTVTLKIQKPSGKYTEVTLPLKDFEERTFYWDFNEAKDALFSLTDVPFFRTSYINKLKEGF